jgi:hypothetical protein
MKAITRRSIPSSWFFVLLLAGGCAAPEGGAPTGQGVFKHFLAGGNSTESAEGSAADIVTGPEDADPGPIEQEQPDVVEDAPGAGVGDDVIVPPVVDVQAQAEAQDVEAPAPPQIPDAPEPIEVEVPVEAVAIELPQVDIAEPEPLQERIEIIDESMDSLTDFDDPTD